MSRDLHPAAADPVRLLADCDERRTRRSGPGGQHRNKVETAIVLRHRPSGLSTEASERRSQAANREVAVFRLRLNLALAVRLPFGLDDAPSPAWRSRCRSGRVAINAGHDDFPALLAEALDVVWSLGGDVRPAAEALGCTASQLTKLLKLEPRALALVNDERRRRGLHPLQ